MTQVTKKEVSMITKFVLTNLAHTKVDPYVEQRMTHSIQTLIKKNLHKYLKIFQLKQL